jgi:uncharacterized protein (UPF0332 family)
LRSRDFIECLRKKKIVPFRQAKTLAGKEIKAAEEDLAEARDRFDHRRYKYATIIGYYAVFHSARSLVYSRGYRERSHQCLAVALRALFVDSGLLPERYVSMLQDTMSLREDADYMGAFSEKGAALSISCAEAFVAAAKTLLER